MKFHAGYITEKTTPHKISADLEEVFQDPKPFLKWFKPVLTVNLNKFNTEWNEQVHFLYGHLSFGSLCFEYKDGKYLNILESFDENNIIQPSDFSDVFEEDQEFNTLSELPIERDYGRKGNYVEFKEFDLPSLDDETDIFQWKKEVDPILKLQNTEKWPNEEFTGIENVFVGESPWWIQYPAGLGYHGEDGWYFIGQLYMPHFSSWCFGYHQYLFFNPLENKVYIENFHS